MTTTPQSNRFIECFTLGPYQTNCYVVSTGRGGCWIVDASFSPGPIVRYVRERGLTPEALILTHAHVDHIAGVREVVSAFPGLPVWIHEAEAAWLNDPVLNLSAMGGPGGATTAPGPDRLLRHGEVLWLGAHAGGTDAGGTAEGGGGGIAWEVRHTPGHSPGGISLITGEREGEREGERKGGVAIVGDALFAGSIGRTDFPGSDHATLLASIRTRLYTLPDDTRVLPGHGPATTIGREKRSNPYVREGR